MRQFIPAGLLGFVVAALLAAVMSTCDAFMISGAALVMKNLPLPGKIDAWKNAHSLLSARLITLFVLGCSVFFALDIPTLVEGQKVLWRVMALFGVPFWLGLLWRRANAMGAVAGILSAIFVIFLTGDLWGHGLNWPIEKQIALYLPAGFLAMILGSVLSSKQTKDVEKNFWQRLQASTSSSYTSAGVDASRTLASGLTGLFLLDVWRVAIFKWQRYKSELLIFLLIGGIGLLLVLILKLLVLF